MNLLWQKVEVNTGYKLPKCGKSWYFGMTAVLRGPLLKIQRNIIIEIIICARENKLQEEHVFNWWCQSMHKKCVRILSKLKSKDWIRTHKYGVRIPRTVKEANEINAFNKNTLWWDYIILEMKMLRLVFDIVISHRKALVESQEIVPYHIWHQTWWKHQEEALTGRIWPQDQNVWYIH